MKKTLALVFLMALALACAAPPTNKDLSVGTNRAANVAPEKPAAMAMTEADAIAKEKAIWETIKTKDYVAFADMLAEEQVEVIDIGVNDKAASIAGVKEFEPSEVVFSDWKYLPIDKDAVIVAYTANYKGKFSGKEFAQTVRASSAWVNRAGKWVAIFHQECPLRPPMAQPAASKAPAKPAASPAVAATTAAPGTDPIANEKMVWELFKNKNYDAFSNLLATDFLEIEPDGYYDKAGSVKGVSMMDATKFVLSDFKTVSIDADAALVTYVATEPKMAPKGERHSTIWVNRDGKWQGLLHHGGTPVAPKPATPKASPKAAASPSPTVK